MFNEGDYEGCWKKVKEDIVNKDGEKIGEKFNADWVCINVKGMSFERAVEVCQHEVGHEIFAEICEKNMTKCYEVQE